jgi:hypothetical protein
LPLTLGGLCSPCGFSSSASTAAAMLGTALHGYELDEASKSTRSC